MSRLLLLLLAVFSAACDRHSHRPHAFGSPLSPQEVMSGFEFLTTETQALQNDDFENPGLLWSEKGRDLFEASSGISPSCLSCHEDRLKGVAASFPKLGQQSGELLNLERQINLCRAEHQSAAPLEYESDELLALASYISLQSKGSERTVNVDGPIQKHYVNGKDYFFTRRGQFNLSCHQCHDLNWGKKLRGDTISQGHLNAFPAYRMEWQSLGSSHRRLRDCDIGVRAEPLPYGDQRYIELELYLAARSSGLAIEAPGVRR